MSFFNHLRHTPIATDTYDTIIADANRDIERAQLTILSAERSRARSSETTRDFINASVPLTARFKQNHVAGQLLATMIQPVNKKDSK